MAKKALNEMSFGKAVGSSGIVAEIILGDAGIRNLIENINSVNLI